jgi:hypothetical protein
MLEFYHNVNEEKIMRLYVLQCRERGTDNDWVNDNHTFCVNKREAESHLDHATREDEMLVRDIDSAQRAIAYYEMKSKYEYRIGATDQGTFHDAEDDNDWWSQ